MSFQVSGRISDSGFPAEVTGGQALPPGTEVEGYEIDSVLGSSRFNITYLVRDLRHGSFFVLKENFPVHFTTRHPVSLKAGPLDIDGGDAESFVWSVENFEEEARQLAAIFHPGVVRVLKIFRAFGTAFYVMPYVEGSSLDEQIGHRLACGLDFSEDEVTGLLWRMMNALECLHDQGICHLDIHPENILITDQGIPCLKNFGAARQHLCERFLTMVELSIYTPPEQSALGGEVGPWSDLFALAACVRTAMTGELPAVDVGAPVFGDSVPLSGREELSRRFSRELLESIDRALDPTVAARFRSVAEWRKALWGGSESALSEPEEPSMISREAGKVVHSPLLRGSERPVLAATTAEEIGGNHSDETIGNNLTDGSRDVEETIVTTLPEVDFSEWIPAEPKLRPAISFGRLITAVLVLGALVVLLMWRFPLPPEKSPVPVATSVSLSGPNVSATIGREDNAPPRPVASSISKPASTVESLPEVALDSAPVAPVDEPVPSIAGSEAGDERVFAGIMMKWCPPGQFQMGSPWNEKGRFQDESPHQVHLTRGFWIAKTELTQGQWKQVMGNNPSVIQRDNLPVDLVEWSDVQAWMGKMNQEHPPAPGWKWAMPTEAQWEYACRAGTTTPIYSGPLEILGERNAPALDPIAWYGGNSSVGYTGDGFDTSIWPEKQYPGGRAGVRDVGGKLPNAWGIHDMLGNVWEWCEDWYDVYPLGSVTDPTGPPTGTTRVMRGGSWGNGAVVCRSAVRGEDSPENKGEGLGFRCVIVPMKD